MFCQICGTYNDQEQEFCRRCHQRLLVISGPYAQEFEESREEDPEGQLSLDEHLLERISILEEVVKRTTATLRHSLEALYKLEQKILVNQTGITTLQDLLERKRVLAREEWSELWESRMDQQLLALEKREVFATARPRIAALYQGDEAEEFRGLLERAEELLRGFDIVGAVEVLESALHRDPGNHELAFFLGETYFNEEQSEQALAHFDRVLEIKPSHYESLIYGGVLCHARGDDTRAEELLRLAVSQYPQAFLPSFSLGAVLANQGHLQQAVVFLERAVAAEPEPQAHFLLGSCYHEMGRVGATIRHLLRAVSLDPTFAEAYQLLGLAYLERRWVHKAQAAYRESRILQPFQLSYHDLVQLLAEADGSWPELEPQTLSWLQQAEASLHEGRVGEALHGYRRALAHDAENPVLLTAYAMACLELGRIREIEPVIGKVLELAPGERLRIGAYTTWIEALRKEGKFRESNRLSRVLLGEESDFAQTVACFELAFNLAEMEEDLDEALRYARRSVELSPPGMERVPLTALGWVHFKRREFPQSIECLSRSRDLGASAGSLVYLGMALIAEGSREEARQVLQEARELENTRGALGEKILAALKEGARMLQDPPVQNRTGTLSGAVRPSGL